MSEAGAEQARQALLALADLSPSAEQSAGGLTVPTDWFRWLSARSVRIFDNPAWARQAAAHEVTYLPYAGDVDQRFADRLAAVDRLRGEGTTLQIGWLWVAGRLPEQDGKRRRVLHPLLTMRVRVHHEIGSRTVLRPIGDLQVTPLAENPTWRARLEHNVVTAAGAIGRISSPEIPADLLPRLTSMASYARSAARAAGFPATDVIAATAGPEELLRRDDLVIVAGVAVYSRVDTGTSSRAASLRDWTTKDLLRWTAFHTAYADADPPGAIAGPAPDIESAYLLTPTQREAIRQSTHRPMTVLSGPPGTGKSHTIAAIALDALARGEDVLVAAKSDATVDALLDLFERAPGPDPVVFGSSARRDALAKRLAGGLRPVAREVVRGARAQRDDAVAARDAAGIAIRRDLDAEARLGTIGPATVTHPVAPRLFEPDADLAEADALLATARRGGGWWARRRGRKAARGLARLAGTGTDVPLEALAAALDEAHAVRTSRTMAATGGLDLTARWSALRTLDDRAHETTARWLAEEVRSEDRLGRAALGAVAAVATALRSGRAARREQLNRIDDDRLTKALPLWLGTLPDIDDLLPASPGLFDLVILDEASSIDQPLAAPALLRGKRAVVVGDPNQLRHVSFLADDQQTAVLARHGLDAAPAVRTKLDVRRNSAFDVAASVAPVLTLDEHFRSDPHLVDFVARRVYGGNVHVATRSPRTTGIDCVDLARVAGERDAGGVVVAEVRWVLERLHRHVREGSRSVGVITPFRAQADALEEAVLRDLPLASVEALDLRVGTVHAFQGNERDEVIASIGIGPSTSAASWRFVDDPALFTVLVTRARRHLTLVLSADPPAGGLVADYLAQADEPPGRPAAGGPVSAWAEALGTDLEAAGVIVTRAYPTGRHAVDLCLGDGERSLAVVCSVHPDGSAAHIRRHLALVRAGWTVFEALPSRWEERRGELVVELLRRVRA
jgi:AAA domain